MSLSFCNLQPKMGLMLIAIFKYGKKFSGDTKCHICLSFRNNANFAIIQSFHILLSWRELFGFGQLLLEEAYLEPIFNINFVNFSIFWKGIKLFIYNKKYFSWFYHKWPSINSVVVVYSNFDRITNAIGSNDSRAEDET